MRAHIIQHIWFEDSGTISEILKERGWVITVSQIDNGDQLPQTLENIDLLVIMGGFMSAYDEINYPFLRDEKMLIKMAAQQGIKTLGICLGAQLIASAFGANVYPNTHKEIGWLDIKSTQNCPFLPTKLTVFQWHGDTFDLPPSAELLASSEICKNQAFMINSSVIALQFHLEVTPKTVLQLVNNCREELIDAPYIQSEEVILNAPQENYANIKSIMSNLLDFLLAKNSAK